MKTDDGGPAFPGKNRVIEISHEIGPPEALVEWLPGMNMRQYYKAAALTGLLMSKVGHLDDMCDPPAAAIWAREYADAMILEDAEHEKGAKP